MKNWSLSLLAPAMVALMAAPAFAHAGEACCATNQPCCHTATKSACCATSASMEQPAAKTEMVTETYMVKGMHCEKCSNFVFKSLSDVKGVSKVDVSLKNKTATVHFTQGKIALAKLNAALKGNYTLSECNMPMGKDAKGNTCPAGMMDEKSDQKMDNGTMAPMDHK